MTQLTERGLAHLGPVAVLKTEHAAALQELDDLHGLSPATRKAYTHDWQCFASWCEIHRYPSFPAPGSVVATYCEQRAAGGAKYAYICRSVSAISQLHQRANVPNPRESDELRRALRNIARRNGTAQHQVAPLMLEDIRKLLAIDATSPFKSARDKALILTAYLGAFRRSEVVAIRGEHLSFCEQGVDILMPRSKTDRKGRGRVISIPYCREQLDVCAVRALKNWWEMVNTQTEWVFPSITPPSTLRAKHLGGRDVARIVQDMCKRAGLGAKHYAGHSLRAGLATQASRSGASTRAIQRQTGHANLDVLMRYIRDGNRWKENVVTEMGL